MTRNNPQNEVERLKKRITRLSQAKSHLQLLSDLLTSLAKVTGIKDTLQHSINMVMETLGGTYLIIYYKVDDQWHTYDMFGCENTLDDLDDESVAKAISQGELLEEKVETESNKLLGKPLPLADWIFPLKAGSKVFGAFKIGGIRLTLAQTVKYQLDVYMSYIGLTLHSEILNFSRLSVAYDELSIKNEELEREVLERRRAEKELVRYRDHLEKLVEERTNELKKEKAKAEIASNAKSEFLANMSHEIRTPLNAVIGLTDLAQKTVLTPKQEDYLTKISTSARLLLSTINDILDFSKIEANRLDIEEMAFPLDRVLNSLIDLMGVQMEKKGIEFLFDIDPLIPRHFVGDPFRLGQVLINLTTNALKFTEAGSVVVGIRRSKMDQQANGNDMELQFFVHDTGIGLSKAQVKTLFQPFHQADSSTTRKYGGTGLGLSICKNLVKMMGGCIEVESQPGQGSTFFFTVRLGLTEDREKCLSVPDRLCNRKLTVLVVDDNETARAVLRESLNACGFEVLEASSGLEALKVVKETESQKRPLALVLMDFKMPGMDGIETTYKLKTELKMSKAPAVLMITAYGRDEVRQRAEKAGIDGFLLKPINPSLLYDSILDIMGFENRNKITSPPKSDRDSRRMKSIAGAHVLLVEDNELNQQIAMEHLQHVGLYVSIANNGVEALRMMEEYTYDLVLMDIQMPRMDGYETTLAIRRREESLGGGPVPISAMTAHAMSNERERCLAVGMNGYITKPIDPQKLYAVLLTLIKPGERKEPFQIHPKSDGEIEAILPKDLPGLNIAKALNLLSGNRTFLISMLHKFVTDYADSPTELRKTIQNGQASSAIRLAHTVKGLAANIGAEKLSETALAIEEKAEKITVSDALHLITAYEKALNEVMRAASLCSLLPVVPEPSGEHKPPPTKDAPTHTEDIVAQLMTMTENGEMNSLDYFLENKKALEKSGLKKHFKEIETLLRDFDLQEAHFLIKPIFNGE